MRTDRSLRLACLRAFARFSSRDIDHDFICKCATSRQPPAQGFDEPFIPLPAFGLCRGLRGVGKRRRAGQPEADKQRERFIGDGDMAFETFDLPGHAIEPPRQRGLQPVGAVGRQMRGERRLYDQRLGNPLSVGIVGELAGEIWRQAESVLGAHVLKAHIVARIEGYLPSERAGPPLQDAGVQGGILRFIICQFELAGWLSRLGYDPLMVREFGLTTEAGIVRIFDLFCRRDDRFRPLAIAVARQRIRLAAGVRLGLGHGGRYDPRLQLPIFVVTGFLGADRVTPGD
jgi:hypothetical protein